MVHEIVWLPYNRQASPIRPRGCRAFGQQARAQVTAGGDGVRDQGEPGRDRHRDQEHPPPLVPVRARGFR
ncbi:hypothetical protein [Nonomuraea rubra]|uniref:Uncharacterized protein n=2 Tax=Nonomuraea rubra TaxID=46180 RepID=A0A7X0NKY6_9ACTN|nr:hypothetical protein [Nonomuraea rubra]MBB6545367.1 hypothetical protein [Nonomuraea rubra]